MTASVPALAHEGPGFSAYPGQAPNEPAADPREALLGLTGHLAAALHMVRFGYGVIPMDGKRPHSEFLFQTYGDPGWLHLAKQPASRPDIDTWFTLHGPDPDVGIIVPAGRVVLDIDDVEAFHREGLTHPAAPMVRTPSGGLHIYLTGNVVGVIVKSWGEIRGAGSIVRCPSSPEPSGQGYAWVLTHHDVAPAPLPRALIPQGSASIPHRPIVGPMGNAPVDPVAALSHDPNAVAKLMAHLDRPDALRHGRTRNFRCLMPTHRDRRPSAGLYRSEHGAFRYRCQGCGATLSLPRLFAAVTSGRPDALDDMTPASARRWTLRMWADAGVRPVKATATMPTGVSSNARRLAHGYAHLCALRASTGDTDPVPFARQFAADWTGLNQDQVRYGITELRRCGWLRPVEPGRQFVPTLYANSETAESLPGVAQVARPNDPLALKTEPVIAAQPDQKPAHLSLMVGAQAVPALGLR